MADYFNRPCFTPSFGTAEASVPSFWRRLRTEMAVEGGDVLRVTRTGEVMVVTRAGNCLVDVERGVGSIPCPIEAGDELLRIGAVESEEP